MDPSMIAGVAAGVGLIIYGIGFGNIDDFASLNGAVIVLGGTFSALVASFPLRLLKKVPKQTIIAIRGEVPDPIIYINEIVECARTARRKGMLALEEYALAQEDEFMKYSLLLIVDALDAGQVRSMLENDLIYMDERHSEAITFFERGASYAPAFGMIGTLIGLILMLANLSLDASDGSGTLTSGMAMALITTFYGSMLANLFFTPIASKLKAIHEREMLCKQIIIEGMMSIQAGENPRYIQERLIAFLPYNERSLDESERSGGKHHEIKIQKTTKTD